MTKIQNLTEIWDTMMLRGMLSDLILEFGENYGAPVEAAPDSVRRLIDLVRERGVCFVCIKENKIVGAIGGLIHENLFNNKLTMLSELFWYTTPAERGGTVGGRLLRKYLDYGEEKGFSIVMTTLSSTNPSIGRALERKGFHRKEQNFIKWGRGVIGVGR